MKYKLSRKLTAPERAALKQAGSELNEALAAVAKAEKAAIASGERLRQMEARAAKLEKEAARGSVEASSKLTGVKDQIARASNNRGNGREARDVEIQNSRAVELLRSIIWEDVGGQVRDLVEERNADFFHDKDGARRVALNCDALQVLGIEFGAKPHQAEEGLIAEGQRLSGLIDSLLKGGTVWEFPKNGSKR